MASITGTKFDNNLKFDTKKLLAMDPMELEKLNGLYQEYLRYHGPLFTKEIWSECLETFFLKADKYDDEKSNGKFFAWFNVLCLNEFRRVLNSKKRKRKIDVVFYDDVFSSSSPVTTSNESLPSESNAALIDEFDFDSIIDNPDGEPNKLDVLIKKYAWPDEKEPLELYRRGAQTTKEERALVIRFKNRVLRRIYNTQELAALRKSGKHLNKSRKSIGVRARIKEDKSTYGSAYKKMTPEQRLELRIKKRDARREKKLKEYKEKLSPKEYAEKIRQMEYYEKVRDEQNKKNIETQRKIREKVAKEKAELRKSIKKEQNGETL